jgi:hypothetical protein
MRLTLTSLLLLGLLAGCTPWLPVEQLTTGINKAEVLRRLGKPTDAAGSGNVEYLWYNPANRFWQRYYVKLVDGTVESYGPLGSEPAAAK